MLDTSNIEVKMSCVVLNDIMSQLEERDTKMLNVGDMEVSREVLRIREEKLKGSVEPKIIPEKEEQKPVLETKVNILDTEDEPII